MISLSASAEARSRNRISRNGALPFVFLLLQRKVSRTGCPECTVYRLVDLRGSKNSTPHPARTRAVVSRQTDPSEGVRDSVAEVGESRMLILISRSNPLGPGTASELDSSPVRRTPTRTSLNQSCAIVPKRQSRPLSLRILIGAPSPHDFSRST